MKKLFIQQLEALFPFALIAHEKEIQFVQGAFAEKFIRFEEENTNHMNPKYVKITDYLCKNHVNHLPVYVKNTTENKLASDIILHKKPLHFFII